MKTRTIRVLQICIASFVFVFIFIVGITIKQRGETKKRDTQTVVMVGLQKNQAKGLIKEYEKAFKQASHIKKGDELLKVGKLDEAILEFKVALTSAKSKGTKGEASLYLANAYEKKKDYKKALEYVIVDRDEYVNDWAKAPIIERAKYLKYASQGNYEKAVEYAEKAIEEDVMLFDRKKPREDYVERLNDIRASKEYIEHLKRK